MRRHRRQLPGAGYDLHWTDAARRAHARREAGDRQRRNADRFAVGDAEPCPRKVGRDAILSNYQDDPEGGEVQGKIVHGDQGNPSH